MGSDSQELSVLFGGVQRIRNLLGVIGPLFFATRVPQLLLTHRVSYLLQRRLTGFHADARPSSMERISRTQKLQSERINLPDWSRQQTNAARGLLIMVSRHVAIYSNEHQLQSLCRLDCYT